MLKSCGRVVGWVACMILETAQGLNFSFPFLFDFGLGTWDLDLGLSISFLLLTFISEFSQSNHPECKKVFFIASVKHRMLILMFVSVFFLIKKSCENLF